MFLLRFSTKSHVYIMMMSIIYVYPQWVCFFSLQGMRCLIRMRNLYGRIESKVFPKATKFDLGFISCIPTDLNLHVCIEKQK